jgi:hypothetical protein
MAWDERTGATGGTVDDRRPVREWERSDGLATIRVRERVDGDWVVRLDVLHQASSDRTYRRDRTDTQDEALQLAAEWRDTFDVDAETGR